MFIINATHSCKIFYRYYKNSNKTIEKKNNRLVGLERTKKKNSPISTYKTVFSAVIFFGYVVLNPE